MDMFLNYQEIFQKNEMIQLANSLTLVNEGDLY